MKNKIKFSLKSKVVFLNIGIVFIFASILVIMLNRLTVNTLINSKRETTKVVIEGQAREVEFALSRPLGAVEALSKNDKVVSYLSEDKPKTGKAVLDLFESVSVGREYSNIYIMDKNGNVILSVDPSFLNNNFAFRDYFVEGLQGKPHMQIAFGVLTHKAGYYFSAPIVVDSMVKGVVVIKMDVSYISKIFENSPTKRIGHFFLTDENGVVVYSDKEIEEYQSLGKLPEDRRKKIVDERRFEGFGLKPLQYQVAQEAIDKYTIPTTIDYLDMEDGESEDGELELLQIQKVGSYPFYLVTESSLDSIISQLNGILWPIVYLMGGAVGVGIFIQYLVLAKLFLPLKILEKFSKDVSEGKTDQIIKINSKDELESLSTNIGIMVSILNDSKRDLEVKVNEKTLELTKKIEELNEKNIEQENGQVAMLNVLEDSKLLEAQLEEEKKSVELKVVERTKELSAEQARLNASISALPQAFIIVDKDLNIISQNGKLEDLFGKIESNWNLKIIDDFMGKNFELVKKLEEIIKNKKVFDINEFEHGFKFLRIFMAPVLNSENEQIGAIIMIQDVTEEKILSRSKDEFFSIASHELRTPLAAIRGNSEMIIDNYAKAIKDPDVKEMLADIHEGSLRLIAIVNDFLNISRIEMKKIEYKIEDIDLQKLVEDTMDECQNLETKEGKYLKLEKNKTSIGKVKGDSARIKEVLINLIGNGFKFTKKGGVTISIRSAEDSVEVCVTDTGEGIPKELQGLLFRKFQQAGSSLYTRDTTKGTGLGLYISKLLLEGMKGQIWLESSETGKGSTFCFKLPLVK